MFLRPFALYCNACFGILCPSSVRVVATFSGTVLQPLLRSVLPFFPLIHQLFSLSSLNNKLIFEKVNKNKIMEKINKLALDQFGIT